MMLQICWFKPTKQAWFILQALPPSVLLDVLLSNICQAEQIFTDITSSY